MSASARPSSYHYVVDEPLLRTITAEIQAAIPGAEVRLFGSRARGTARPDSDLDLLVTVPDAWLVNHSRFKETDSLGWKLAHHRIPLDLLLYSHREVQERSEYCQHVVTEAIETGLSSMPSDRQREAGSDALNLPSGSQGCEVDARSRFV